MTRSPVNPADDSVASRVPCELAVGGRGVLVGWQGPHGPALASLRSPRALSPDGSVHLGHERMGGAQAPRFGWHGREVVTSFRQPDGAWLTIGEGVVPVWLAPDVRAVAHAGQGDVIAVAVVDGDGVIFTRFALGTGARIEEPRRLVERRRVGTALDVVMGMDGALVLWALADEPVLAVSKVGQEGVREVRHRLPAVCRGLHALQVGTRTAVGLGLDAEAAYGALLGPRGEMRERPHAVFRSPRGTMSTPRVLWADRAFALAAVDGADGSLCIEPLHEREGPRLRLAGVGGPFGVDYFNGRVVAGGVRSDAQGAALRLVMSDRDGTATQVTELDVTPFDVHSRRRGLDAREGVQRLRAELAARGYRGGATSVSVDSDGLGLRAHDGRQWLSWRFEPHDEEHRITLRVGRGEPGVSSPEWLRRVLGWLRRRLSRDARLEAERRVRWARRVVGAPEVRVRGVEERGDGLRMEIGCDVLPAADALECWAQRARARLNLDHR